MSDRIILNLPFPLSVNRIWRATGIGGHAVARSPQYRQWINQADRLVWATRGPPPHPQKITGPFTARITLDRNRRRIDLDNIKCVLDYAQRIELIANDKHCERLTVEWGASADAPHGCRLELTAIAARDAAE